jgi:hypothetical protein
MHGRRQAHNFTTEQDVSQIFVDNEGRATSRPRAKIREGFRKLHQLNSKKMDLLMNDFRQRQLLNRPQRSRGLTQGHFPFSGSQLPDVSIEEAMEQA